MARATSLVRYAPNSEFSRHVHGGGEEYLVLDGVFSDEHGDYPKGTYVRNPIGTGHTPRIGSEGCTIFVKLHQFDPADTTPVVVNMTELTDEGGLAGLEVAGLHSFESEQVAILRWHPGAEHTLRSQDWLEEIFVLEGSLADQHGVYPAGTWLRNPPAHKRMPYASENGALIYHKLSQAPADADPPA